MFDLGATADTSGNSAPTFTVSEFVEVCNQSLEYAFTGVVVEGEIASFKVNQGKWVFFDLKEGDTSVNCFMALTQLGVALSDGMRVRVQATPKLTRWGRFSLTVRMVLPLGEGNIKKSFEELKRKLAQEGIFDPARKRPLPANLSRIGVISSTGAAGYLDFLKILDNRWGGIDIFTINTQVQGLDAPSQIIRAVEYFNQQGRVDVIAILRGGGSADDLAAFNDEQLARAIAASRIPVITGIGHEIDESLADLAADVRASTPSNAAERLVPDRAAMRAQIRLQLEHIHQQILSQIDLVRSANRARMQQLGQEITHRLELQLQHIKETVKILASLSPESTMRRGYAIVTGKLSPGNVVKITTSDQIITTEVKHVTNR